MFSATALNVMFSATALYSSLLLLLFSVIAGQEVQIPLSKVPEQWEPLPVYNTLRVAIIGKYLAFVDQQTVCRY